MNQLAQTKEQKHVKIFNYQVILCLKHTSFQVLDAYKAAAGAFKADLARHGLTMDKVDETMDDIEEVEIKLIKISIFN